MSKMKITRICTLDGCNKPSRVNKVCMMHHARMRTHGSYDTALTNFGTGNTPEERFWSRVDKTAACWNWTGHVQVGGYGHVQFKGKLYVAHRLAWFFTYGSHPTQLLLHSCDNPRCVNPSHLREGTAKENSGDAISRNRTARGTAVNTAKLQESDILRIRQSLTEGTRIADLARKFNVTWQNIRAIRDRQTWTHI